VVDEAVTYASKVSAKCSRGTCQISVPSFRKVNINTAHFLLAPTLDTSPINMSAKETKDDLGSWWWPWAPTKKNPASPIDASHDQALRSHFLRFLDYTEPPNVFKSSEVAQMLTPAELANLGYDDYRDAIMAVKVIAWDMREFGDCIIYCKGPDGKYSKKVPSNVSWMEVDGPVRFKRKGTVHSDDWD